MVCSVCTRFSGAHIVTRFSGAHLVQLSFKIALILQNLFFHSCKKRRTRRVIIALIAFEHCILSLNVKCAQPRESETWHHNVVRCAVTSSETFKLIFTGTTTVFLQIGLQQPLRFTCIFHQQDTCLSSIIQNAVLMWPELANDLAVVEKQQ